MAEESKMLDAPGADQYAERDEARIPPSQPDIGKVQPLGRSRFLGLQDRLERFEKSAAGRYWAHLSTADFMNSSFAFAALAVLSAFPFLAVTSSVIGGDIRTTVVARMGLNAQATHDVEGLIATGDQAVETLPSVSDLVLVV